MPAIRGLIGKDSLKLGHFDDSAAVLEFVSSKDLRPLAALGTSCPDHFLRHQDPAAGGGVRSAKAGRGRWWWPALADATEAYRKDYAAYYERSKHPDSPGMRDANAVVYLVPGVGMLTFAKDKATARISGEFYVNAINVMRGASTVSTYQGLPEQEAFDIEYWLLEEAKLFRMPKAEESLAGHIALVTGGATAWHRQGDGAAAARRGRLRGAGRSSTRHGARAPPMMSSAKPSARTSSGRSKSTSPRKNRSSKATPGWPVEFGGIDILVSNAGLASSAPHPRRRRWRCGTATWTSSPPVISW